MIGQQDDKNRIKNSVFLDWDGTMDMDHAVPKDEKKEFWRKSFETLERLLKDSNTDVYILTANTPLQIATIIETAWKSNNFKENEFPQLRAWLRSDKINQFKIYSEKILQLDRAFGRIRDSSFKWLNSDDLKLFQDCINEMNEIVNPAQLQSPTQRLCLQIVEDGLGKIQAPEDKQGQIQYIETLLRKIKDYPFDENVRIDDRNEIKRQILKDLFKIENLTSRDEDKLDEILESNIEDAILKLAELKQINKNQEHDICLDVSKKILGNIKAIASNFYNHLPDKLMNSLEVDGREINSREKILPIDEGNSLGFYSGMHQKQFAIQNYLSKMGSPENVFFADDSPENVLAVQEYMTSSYPSIHCGVFTVPQYTQPSAMAHFDFFQSLPNLSEQEIKDYRSRDLKGVEGFYSTKKEVLSFLDEADRRLKEDIQKIETLNAQNSSALSLFSHKKGAQDPILMKMTEYHTLLLKVKDSIDRDPGPDPKKIHDNIALLILQVQVLAQDKVVQKAPVEKRKISEGFFVWMAEKLGVLNKKALALSEIKRQASGMGVLSKESGSIVNDAQKVIALDKKIAEKEKILNGPGGYIELRNTLAKAAAENPYLFNVSVSNSDDQAKQFAADMLWAKYKNGDSVYLKTVLDYLKLKLKDKPEEFKVIKHALENYEHRKNFNKEVDVLKSQRDGLLQKPGVKAAVEAARGAEEKAKPKPK